VSQTNIVRVRLDGSCKSACIYEWVDISKLLKLTTTGSVTLEKTPSFEFWEARIKE